MSKEAIQSLYGLILDLMLSLPFEVLRHHERDEVVSSLLEKSLFSSESQAFRIICIFCRLVYTIAAPLRFVSIPVRL